MVSAIDPSQFGRRIERDPPCGPDCEYEPAFQSMEQAYQGEPERQIGSSIEPATGPDWKAVKRQATDVLAQSIDIRAAVYLARATLVLDGWVDFSVILQWLANQIDTHWDTIHPRLDPDDNDPTFRVNSLVALIHPSALLGEIRDAPLVRSRAIGQFSLRDIDIATGKINPSAAADPDDVPQLNAINAAFADADLATMQADEAAIDDAIRAAGAINTTLSEQLGASQAPDFEPLMAELDSAKRQLVSRLTERGARVVSSGDDESPADSAALVLESEPSIDPQGATRVTPPIPGTISNRQEVAQMLDRISEYYQRYEPTSPVPLLLNRAKSLVFKDFIEILKDVAPDAVAKVEALRGPITNAANGDSKDGD